MRNRIPLVEPEPAAGGARHHVEGGVQSDRRSIRLNVKEDSNPSLPRGVLTAEHTRPRGTSRLRASPQLLGRWDGAGTSPQETAA